MKQKYVTLSPLSKNSPSNSIRNVNDDFSVVTTFQILAAGEIKGKYKNSEKLDFDSDSKLYWTFEMASWRDIKLRIQNYVNTHLDWFSVCFCLPSLMHWSFHDANQNVLIGLKFNLSSTKSTHLTDWFLANYINCFFEMLFWSKFALKWAFIE